jgi:hypothetical protein
MKRIIYLMVGGFLWKWLQKRRSPRTASPGSNPPSNVNT